MIIPEDLPQRAKIKYREVGGTTTQTFDYVAQCSECAFGAYASDNCYAKRYATILFADIISIEWLGKVQK